MTKACIILSAYFTCTGHFTSGFLCSRTETPWCPPYLEGGGGEKKRIKKFSVSEMGGHCNNDFLSNPNISKTLSNHDISLVQDHLNIKILRLPDDK